MIKSRGFGIAETLIASVLLAMLAISFFTLNASIRTNILVGNSRAVAAELAQQELEKLRFLVEESWTESRRALAGTAASWDAKLTGPQVSLSKQEVATINGVVYSRQYFVSEPITGLPKLRQGGLVVSAAHLAPAARRVRVLISWPEGSRTRQYELYSLFTDYRSGLL